MQKSTLILLAFLFLVGITRAQESPETYTDEDLREVRELMTGFFSTKNQWEQDTSYFYIRLCMQPLWPESDAGYWLYVEQAAYASPDRPYRQRVYHLYLHSSGESVVSKVYEIDDPDYFVGACTEPQLLDVMTPERLVDRPGCELYLTRADDGTFHGSTREGTCLSTWRGASWVSSDVVIDKSGLNTWDRGWDKQGNLVWGPEEEGYRFDREVEEEEEEVEEENGEGKTETGKRNAN